MKIGDIELTTTAEEIDEIARQLNQTDELNNRNDDLGLVPLIIESKEFGGQSCDVQAGVTAGILIGATLYSRRLADRGAAMMHGATGEELAVGEALETALRDVIGQCYSSEFDVKIFAKSKPFTIQKAEELLVGTTPAVTDTDDRDGEVERLREVATNAANALEYWVEIAQYQPKYAAWLGKARDVVTATRTALNDGRGDGGEGDGRE